MKTGTNLVTTNFSEREAIVILKTYGFDPELDMDYVLGKKQEKSSFDHLIYNTLYEKFGNHERKKWRKEILRLKDLYMTPGLSFMELYNFGKKKYLLVVHGLYDGGYPIDVRFPIFQGVIDIEQWKKEYPPKQKEVA